MPLFGQIIIGPPGAGKSTYCNAMQQYLKSLPRPVSVVNLDPANDATPYECDVDVRDLIRVEDVMRYKALGPNGGLVYCMEHIETKIDWLRSQLSALESNNSRTYLLVDFPGQVELFTHHDCVKSILSHLTKWGHRFVVVYLADSHYCTDPAKFISVLLTTLTAMVNLELPHISLLSKGDLLESNSISLPFNLQYFTEVQDLRQLLLLLQDDPFLAPYKKLSEQIVSVIEDYALVSFMLLNIQDAQSMRVVLALADKANGYCFHETDAPDLRHIMKTSGSADPIKAYNRACADKFT